jgi:hypothetical protein
LPLGYGFLSSLRPIPRNRLAHSRALSWPSWQAARKRRASLFRFLSCGSKRGLPASIWRARDYSFGLAAVFLLLAATALVLGDVCQGIGRLGAGLRNAQRRAPRPLDALQLAIGLDLQQFGPIAVILRPTRDSAGSPQSLPCSESGGARSTCGLTVVRPEPAGLGQLALSARFCFLFELAAILCIVRGCPAQTGHIDNKELLGSRTAVLCFAALPFYDSRHIVVVIGVFVPIRWWS